MDCIWVNLKNVVPPFFQIYDMPVYTCIKMSFIQLENHSQLLCSQKVSWTATLAFRAHNQQN